jgi:TolB protein
VRREEPEALIEEARQRARRRRRRYAAGVALAALAGLAAFTVLGRAALAHRRSDPPAAGKAIAAGAGSSPLAFLRTSATPATRWFAIALVHADGSGTRTLARSPWADDVGLFRVVPHWSPDGRRLVFAKRVEGGAALCPHSGRCNDEIVVVNADGSGLRRLTHDTTDDGQASWSPDGRRIAFLSWRDGPNPDVFVMNADGSDQHSLTHTYGSEHEPIWSPDGKKIAFTGAGLAWRSDVYVRDADGGNLRRLTRTRAPEWDLSWSPDGHKLAYVALQGVVAPGNRARLYVVNADGSGRHLLTRLAAFDSAAAWSPDGRRIAFAGADGIYVVDADGSNLRPAARNAARQYSSPAWSPDGQEISFLAWRLVPAGNNTAATDIYVMNADGSGKRNLTQTPAAWEDGVTWAPAPRS